ncbi:MAG: hypothetical protein A2431_01375 [Candidatus Zambryskibacteria bacterium RIFOXYC1_FULL_39_10]|uniref:Uncharacterized protein n=1 Tax=Candidatus Zambryskibacteria bacterium RIFOXYC1_FULL_39_10 TaxID=1802779 RepID=A0A1G2V3W2_9BACT|nr:MAG: hypothetical protein A2605_03355 [Candidatus Zambryskibacteria bacterium RIFOXYD1_FULL_39_35]OHB16336.1 MAG: hypothetical protein A2431_01375 [Candidatus Zambryskibacteria bacterium RIFOXYC1_FULL_39_10]
MIAGTTSPLSGGKTLILPLLEVRLSRTFRYLYLIPVIIFLQASPVDSNLTNRKPLECKFSTGEMEILGFHAMLLLPSDKITQTRGREIYDTPQNYFVN